jgi:cytochrome c-type biogenesis protein CcsB
MLMLIYLLSVFWSPTAKFQKVLKIVRKALLILTGGFFVYHAIGLGFRWYISGHAPWSNGYEAILFIAWVTVLAGWVFIRKIEVVMSGALILAAMMLFVSELNLLDPEITPLVPVLKSYWLMIHVAIITGSYGFLGLSFILGLLNLVLYLFRSQKNGARLSSQIAQITHTSEMTMTVGTFMLTIGTFLGGVWANESWGRYWGWDPKETWALVSILVYAIILHFRFIPKLKGMFAFNIASFWGYSAILFTYFGVNFMLVGLHSYAQGDGLASFPNWLIYTIVVFFVLSILAGIRNWRYTKAN